jgi:hypothetical protein
MDFKSGGLYVGRKIKYQIPMNQNMENHPKIFEVVDGSNMDWVCIHVFKGMPVGMDSEEEVDL